MKTKNIVQTEKTFVEQMREIRDKISLEIKDLTPEQLKEYLNSKKTLHPADVWPK
jgi:hypothetical protein